MLAEGDPPSQRLLRLFRKHRLPPTLALVAILLLASGAITVHAQAIVYTLAAMALFATWRTVSDPAVSRRLETRTAVWAISYLLGSLLVGGLFVILYLRSDHSNANLLLDLGHMVHGRVFPLDC